MTYSYDLRPRSLLKVIESPEKRDEMMNLIHLPKKKLNKLLYLTTFIIEDEKSLLSYEQKKVFEESAHKAKRTYCWLWSGVIGSTAAILTITPLATWIQMSLSTDNIASYVLGGSALTATIGAIANVVSYTATGFFPHFSSQADDKKLMAEEELKKQINDMAYYLIDLFYSKDSDKRILAKEIAGEIQLNLLKKSLIKEVKKEIYADFILSSLKQAILWILFEKKPKDKLLYLTIDNYRKIA